MYIGNKKYRVRKTIQVDLKTETPHSRREDRSKVRRWLAKPKSQVNDIQCAKQTECQLCDKNKYSDKTELIVCLDWKRLRNSPTTHVHGRQDGHSHQLASKSTRRVRIGELS